MPGAIRLAPVADRLKNSRTAAGWRKAGEFVPKSLTGGNETDRHPFSSPKSPARLSASPPRSILPPLFRIQREAASPSVDHETIAIQLQDLHRPSSLRRRGSIDPAQRQSLSDGCVRSLFSAQAARARWLSPGQSCVGSTQLQDCRRGTLRKRKLPYGTGVDRCTRLARRHARSDVIYASAGQRIASRGAVDRPGEACRRQPCSCQSATQASSSDWRCRAECGSRSSGSGRPLPGVSAQAYSAGRRPSCSNNRLKWMPACTGRYRHATAWAISAARAPARRAASGRAGQGLSEGPTDGRSMASFLHRGRRE